LFRTCSNDKGSRCFELMESNPPKSISSPDLTTRGYDTALLHTVCSVSTIQPQKAAFERGTVALRFCGVPDLHQLFLLLLLERLQPAAFEKLLFMAGGELMFSDLGWWAKPFFHLESAVQGMM
jgi:hypothetical protein